MGGHPYHAPCSGTQPEDLHVAQGVAGVSQSAILTSIPVTNSKLLKGRTSRGMLFQVHHRYREDQESVKDFL